MKVQQLFERLERMPVKEREATEVIVRCGPKGGKRSVTFLPPLSQEFIIEASASPDR